MACSLIPGLISLRLSSHEEPTSEGYDEYFDPPLESNYECPICHMGLREPVQTSCGHRFCRGCIVRSIRDGGTKCAVDGEHLLESQIYPDNFAKRRMMAHEVFCRAKKLQGCTWKGPLGKLQEHLKECPFVSVNCANNCGKQLQRRELQRHMTTQCSLRKVPCEYCENEVLWNDTENPPANQHVPAHVQPTDTSPTSTIQRKRFPLPSSFSRSASGPPPAKKRRQATPKNKIYSRNVVCLPPAVDITKPIPIPRGDSRARLNEAGLIGRVAIESSWKANEVEREISTTFASSFFLPDGDILPFDYLSTVPGGKKLTLPKTSPSFRWNASEVLSLASQGSLYIMAKLQPLRIKSQGESDHESEDEMRLLQPVFDPDLKPTSVRGLPAEITANNTSQGKQRSNSPPAVIPNQDLFRSYVSLINEDVIQLDSDEDDSDAGDPVEISKGNETATSYNTTLPEVVQQVQDKINTDEISFINVRRSALWVDTCRQLQRKHFFPYHRISVKFADNEGNSEGAVDVGGPKREFLRLVVKAANEDSGIFIGPARCRSLFPNVVAREKDLYRLVGVVLAWSLGHGGPVGNFFSGTLYDSIAYGPGTRPPRLEDIPDQDLKEKIIQIAESKTDKELKNNLHHEDIQDILDAQGAVKSPVLQNKDSILKIILRHVLVDSTRYLLEDLKKGLETLGVLEAIQKHPEQFRELFTTENIRPLDAATVDSIFRIDFDEQGSNRRDSQELAIIHWRDYLQDCESGDALATLGDVLSFATGADVPPALGFDNSPVIAFTDMAFATANTCATTLRLPTVHDSYDEFKEKMDFSILNSPCFGQA